MVEASCEIVLIWMSLDFTDDQSTLVQVMAWCRQATSHYLSQCWPRSLSPYGVARPQWVNSLWSSDAIWWQPILTFHEWGSGGIHMIVSLHWASKPLCCIMSLKIILLKLLPLLPGTSELITCCRIGDKAYLYRPTQIAERFPIFFISGYVWIVPFHKQAFTDMLRIQYWQ